MDLTYFKILWFWNLSLWILNLFLAKMNWYYHVYVFVCIHLSRFFFDTFSFSVQNQVLRVRRFKERLEVTSDPKEKGRSPNDLCFTEEATELSIVWVNSYRLHLVGWWRVHHRLLSLDFVPKENTQGASWSVKEEKCWGKHPRKMVSFAIFLLKYTETYLLAPRTKQSKPNF